MSQLALINGVGYEFSNIVIQFSNSNLPVLGFTNIEYTQTQEIEDHFASGRYVFERSYGTVAAEASITIKQSELTALERAYGGDLFQSGMFDVIVTYLTKDASKITTDIIKNCEFMEITKGAAQGDKSLEIELPLKTSHIEYNV